ncbi:uncharacterized protein AAEQ78_008045 [Lycaon pictus]
MALRNASFVTEFILAGLTDLPDLQLPLFCLFLLMYVVTVLGNLGLIILIRLNSHLHTPMYFFLFNLSCIDLCYSSVFTPKMLINFTSKKNIISYRGCMTQLYFFCFFAISECYVLTSMAYDRYVAICNPLLYNVVMSSKVCFSLMLGSYLMAFLGAMAHTGYMVRLTFCDANTINHYFCDILPLFQLSCTSTYVNELVVFIVGSIDIIMPCVTIFVSYGFILSSILRISSTEGRSKAFSTCSSHIIAVSLFFGSCAFMYLKPSSAGSMDEGKISSIFYTNTVPLMNPLIYTLRNKDVKLALRKILSRRHIGDSTQTNRSQFKNVLRIILEIFQEREQRRMPPGNASFVTEFILVGLTDLPDLQLPLFCLFLLMYVVTVLGNLGLITLIGLNSHLHTPMYFFLFNLSFIDFCYSSVFTPKMLTNFISKKNMISYRGCMTQLYFFCFFGISECYVLTSMAYDRYVAICNPLLYNVVMSPKVCSLLMLGSYLMAFSGAMAHTGCMLRLTFCDANTINHYFCDILPLLQLSCTSTYVNELVVFIVVGVNIIVPTVTIFVSYGFILSSILRISSTEGRSKAFSTCSSHIIAVSLFFGSGAFMYLHPSSVLSMDQGKVSTVFYTIVVPMLNPLIYSLRNKEVKVALKKSLNRKTFS